MLRWTWQLCSVSSSPPAPVPVPARQHRRGGERGPARQPWRWLPKDTLHFSAIYCIYPRPPRTAPASLRYLEGAARAKGFGAVRATTGNPPTGARPQRSFSGRQPRAMLPELQAHGALLTTARWRASSLCPHSTVPQPGPHPHQVSLLPTPRAPSHPTPLPKDWCNPRRMRGIHACVPGDATPGQPLPHAHHHPSCPRLRSIPGRPAGLQGHPHPRSPPSSPIRGAAVPQSHGVPRQQTQAGTEGDVETLPYGCCLPTLLMTALSFAPRENPALAVIFPLGSRSPACPRV